MDVVIKVLSVVYLLILAVQLQGYLSHKRKEMATQEDVEFVDAGEGEASFS